VEETAFLDAETKVADAPGDHKDELRLWLRLLTCTTMIEQEWAQSRHSIRLSPKL
jgi:hypothetical protein